MRITDTSDANRRDASNTSFSIVLAPSIQVISPNGESRPADRAETAAVAAARAQRAEPVTIRRPAADSVAVPNAAALHPDAAR